jgi:sugar phosphate isomerase/epimerase
MIKGLHGVSLTHSNVVTQARIAKETGYDALELLPEHIIRYLENGGTTDKYNKVLEKYDMKVECINALHGLGRHGKEREELIAEADRLIRIAEAINCPTIQILALHELDHLPEEKALDILVENTKTLAKMAKKHNVRLQIELIAYTIFNHVSQALEVIKRVGEDNVGLLVDFWHFHAAGIDTPETVASLPKEIIYAVHFCDGRKPKPQEFWIETVLRNYMVGDGEVDIPAWVAAVKSTGFDGMWSSELVSPDRWEYDLVDNARECKEVMDKYLD